MHVVDIMTYREGDIISHREGKRKGCHNKG